MEDECESEYGSWIQIIDRYDLRDEIKKNQDGQIKIFNYNSYFVIDAEWYWIICQRMRILRVSKKGRSYLMDYPQNLIMGQIGDS